MNVFTIFRSFIYKNDSHTLDILFFFFNDPPTPEFSPLPLPDALPIPQLLQPPRRGDPARRSDLQHDRLLPGAGGGFRSPDPDAAGAAAGDAAGLEPPAAGAARAGAGADRKSTRLNSSHSQISYAVFCL